jgi:hypothetical protein
MHHLTRAAVCGDWEKLGDLFKCVKCGVAIPYDKNDWRKSEPGRSARVAQQHADPRVPCPDFREDRVPSPILWPVTCWLTVLAAVPLQDVQLSPGFIRACVASVSLHPRRTTLTPPPSAVCRAAGRAPVSGAVLARPSCLLLPRLASPPLT